MIKGLESLARVAGSGHRGGALDLLRDAVAARITRRATTTCSTKPTCRVRHDDDRLTESVNVS